MVEFRSFYYTMLKIILFFQPKSGKTSLKSLQRSVQLLTAISDEGKMVDLSAQVDVRRFTKRDARWEDDSRRPGDERT